MIQLIACKPGIQHITRDPYSSVLLLEFLSKASFCFCSLVVLHATSMSRNLSKLFLSLLAYLVRFSFWYRFFAQPAYSKSNWDLPCQPYTSFCGTKYTFY